MSAAEPPPVPAPASGLDALIVGAGPTGLALAIQLGRFGTQFRIIDRVRDRAHESRALAVQARTLELLQAVGLGERLAAAGLSATRLVIHLDDRVATAELGAFRAPDTRFPFVLFLSQAETEAILGEHLAAHGVHVEREVELVDFQADTTGVDCTLRHGDGRVERVRAAYLVGCDGARSTVRKRAGIAFVGGTYLQDFMLGDVDADGPLERDAIHAFPGRGGFASFFPLRSPRAWRVIAIAPGAPAPPGAPFTSELRLDELQGAVDRATEGRLRLRDPAWLTHFRLHHRQAGRYRSGRVFLAGDAAHIHSPVGGQGMNTGIQDAWNLGWKLALVARGAADPALLDSYEAERWPVGQTLLRTTDRAFDLFSRALAAGPLAARLGRAIAARILPRLFRSERLRTYAFDFVSQTRIHYRSSPAVVEAGPAPSTGPRAGDRLPDARVTRDGRDTWLQQELGGPHLHLLLCGPTEVWDPDPLAALARRYGDVVRVQRLTRRHAADHALRRGAGAVLVDESGAAFRRLGVREPTQLLVRPDGHIAFRAAGRDLDGALRYLARWFGSRGRRP